MKRNIFSVLLLCLVLVSMSIFSACDVEEIEGVIVENDAKAEDRVNDAIAKAESEVNAAAKEAAEQLEAAKAELETLIAAGADADADALEAAVEGFNAAIAAAEATIENNADAIEDVEEYIAALEEEIGTAYAELANLVAVGDEALYAGLQATADELEATKEEQTALAAALDVAIADVMDAITAASADVAAAAEQNLAALKAELLDTIANGDYVTADKLSAAIGKAVDSLANNINTVQNLNMKYTDGRVDTLERDLNRAIETVANAAAENLAIAVGKIEAAMAGDATALEAAIAEYKTLVAAAENTATIANDNLKEELAASITATTQAVADKAAADLATAKTELVEAIATKADAAAVAEANEKVTNDIKVLYAAMDALSEDSELNLSGLQEYIDSRIEAVNAELAEVAEAATAALNAAVGKIEAAMADDAAALEAAIAEYTALADAAKAADKNVADKLNAAIEKSAEDVAAAATAALNAAVGKIEAAMADDAAALEAAIAEYTALADAAKAFATGADAELEEKLTADIEAVEAGLQDSIKAVADKAAADLADAVKKFEDELGGESADIAAAIKELETLIANAEAAAKAADKDVADKLNAAIEKSADDVAAAATQELNAAKDALEKQIAALGTTTAGDLAAATDKLNDKINNINALLKDLSGETDLNFSELQETINAKIDEDLKAAKETADKSYIIIDAWDKATEEIIKAVLTLADKMSDINLNLYYGEEAAEIEALYEAFRIRLYRAVNIEAVNDILEGENSFTAKVAEIATKADEIYAVLTKNGSTVSDVVLSDAWLKALNDASAMILAEEEEDVAKFLEDEGIIELYNDLAGMYAFLIEKEEESEIINTTVADLTAALKEDGYTADNAEAYDEVVKTITSWDKALADAKAHEDNYAMVDREAYAALTEAYNKAVADYDAAMVALKDTLTAVTENPYTYTADGTAFDALVDAQDAYNAWVADVTARGFADDVDDEELVELKAALDARRARADALEQAADDAAAIAKDVADLQEELDNMKVIKSEYQVAHDAIIAAQKDWIAEYFTDAGFAAEAVEGNANYEILDHAAIAKVDETYHDKLDAIQALEDALNEALEGIKEITVYSKNNLDVASAAYTAFTTKIGDLGYTLDSGEAAEITNTIASKTVQYKNLVKAAVEAFGAIGVYAPADVTLAKGAKVDALVAWFDTYLDVDIKVADDIAFADLKLDGLTVTNATVNDAKAAYAAFGELTAAKKVEYDDLVAELEALVDKTPAIAIRGEIDTAWVNYLAWVEGTNAPEGYAPAQFAAVDPTVVEALKVELTELDVAVEAIVANAEAGFEALGVKAPADVKLTNEAGVVALRDWFDTYLAMDITDADLELAADIKLNEVTITVDIVNTAKAASAAYDMLAGAKKKEFADLYTEIYTLIDKAPSTALRDAIDTAWDNYDAWYDGENAPEGYDKEQFIPTAADIDALDALVISLTNRENAVEALEGRLADIKAAIAALELDYEVVVANIDAAKEALAAVQKDIEKFTEDNDDVDCFAGDAETLAAAQLAIDRAVKLADITADYDALMADVNAVADEVVKTNMTDRANAALEAAKVAIVANDAVAFNLAKSNFELFSHTIGEYNAALVAANGDAIIEAEVYEAYVLLDNRDDLTGADEKAIEEMLTIEKKIVTETFKAVIDH